MSSPTVAYRRTCCRRRLVEPGRYDYYYKYLMSYQQLTDSQLSLYNTGSETKRNDNMKIKQTDEHNKSEEQSRDYRVVGKVPKVYGWKDL